MENQQTTSNPAEQVPGDQVVIIEEKISKVNGEIAIKRYSRGKLLGKGGFAKCYEATNLETKKIYAAKIIPKSQLTKNRARQKVKEHFLQFNKSQFLKLKFINHYIITKQCILNMFLKIMNMYIFSQKSAQIKLIFKTLNELIKRRKRLVELEVQCYTLQIVYALKYLHQNHVIHRDLKLGNLFLTDKMELKIGDFGLATKLEFEGELKRTICGTPNYIAPEILDGKVGHSYEVDIWSLGVVIYTMLIGKPPYETPDVKTTYKKIKMNSYQFPDHIPISDDVKSLITKILNLDPSKRPSLDEILQHPFINYGQNIPKLLPLSTLACPPSENYKKQFIGKSGVIANQGIIIKQPQHAILDIPQQNPYNTQNNFQSNSQPNQVRSSTSSTNFNKNQITNPTSKTQNVNPIAANNIKSEVWVTKWVDYSSKYGLGYLLSNGSAGVFFNDSTKIILQPKGQQAKCIFTGLFLRYFEYMEKKPTDRQDIITQYTFNNYPKEFQKKVTLLQHFKNYLEGDKPELATQVEEMNVNQPLGFHETFFKQFVVYLKKWMKTRHAIMFRLSNKIVQVNFTDKTEVILSSELKMLTYVNKKGERSNYPLATALESSNIEMTKRLKYTKEILAHMLNAQQTQAQKPDET